MIRYRHADDVRMVRIGFCKDGETDSSDRVVLLAMDVSCSLR